MMRTILIACVAACLVAGCSSHRQTITTKEGTATVEGSGTNQTVTVKTKEGTTTYGAGVDPSKVGLPIYPGATKTEGGISGTTAQGSSEVVALSTTDGFDKVYAWYRTHMPAGSEKMHVSSPTGSVAAFQTGKENDKELRSVMITSEKDKTSILLSHRMRP